MDTKEQKEAGDGRLDPRRRQEGDGSYAYKDTTSFRRTPSRSTSPRLTRSVTSPVFSSQSFVPSPLGSREASPSRPPQAASKPSGARLARSRKNSTEQSPQRTPSHTPTSTQATPSAAAVQRALAAVGHQKLPSPTTPHFGNDALEPRKTARGTGVAAAQARLKSPPSAGRLQGSGSRTPEQQVGPSGIANHSTSKPSAAIGTIQEEDDSPAPDVKPPGRGGVGSALETVQEDDASQPLAAESDKILKSPQRPSTIQEDPDEDNPEMTSSQITTGTKSSKNTGESGSGSEETASKKEKEKEKAGEQQRSAPGSVAASRKPSITQLNSAKPPSIQPRRSFQHLTPARNKEGSVKSMTVETETVTNPDLLQGDRESRNPVSRLDHGGSIRAKASTETIRPRKDKKRTRKPPSISGTTSSKADIFEAKVANAVDEAANSSDSEETFVYESNPPEPRSSQRGSHAQRYHHSRTPSTASMASQSADAHHRNHFGVAGKKSMKFTNAHQAPDPEDQGTTTYQSNTSRSAHRPRHHLPHVNRVHHGPGESDSPSSGTKSPRTRQFNTWRTHHRDAAHEGDNALTGMGDKKSSNLYDLSTAAEADDEHTPLLPGQRRVGTHYYNHHYRRGGPRSTRNDPYSTKQRSSGMLARSFKYACALLFFGALIAIVVTALVLCNRPLWEVHVKGVHNVLASEQELFLELEVQAINPNLVDVSVAEGKLDIFAKSKYVGTTEMWRDGTIPGIIKDPGSNITWAKPAGQIPGMKKIVQKRDGVDEGTDPMPDPDIGKPQTMLLGKLNSFDSPLIFEASPFQQEPSTSVAGLRLNKPGNRTEEGGSRRWENVLQHQFELIIRGSITYYLPLTSRGLTKNVSARKLIRPDNPDDGDDVGGTPNNGTVGIGRGIGSKKGSQRPWWA